LSHCIDALTSLSSARAVWVAAGPKSPAKSAIETLREGRSIRSMVNWAHAEHRLGPPIVDPVVTKLKPIVVGMDKGPDKAKWNRVEMLAKGRQIDMYMSEGCDPKTPYNAVAQRANVPLTTLLSHGILVLRCNDTKRQCLQSVRDQDDVLCTTAPRHK
jgi:hypothetical protein